MQERRHGKADTVWHTRLSDPMLHAVLALGITQITAWGTTYYALGVLANPIIEDMGWSRSMVFFGFSVALLVMSAVSATVGKLIDTQGARIVMTIGSVLSAAGLVALAFAYSETAISSPGPFSASPCA